MKTFFIYMHGKIGKKIAGKCCYVCIIFINTCLSFQQLIIHVVRFICVQCIKVTNTTFFPTLKFS